MKDRTYYLAGPMSNIPQFNFPLFFRVGTILRGNGYRIVSPAELDDDADKGAALSSVDGNPEDNRTMSGKTWADYLARDVKLITDKVQGIIFLPNWFQSRGARLEAYVGLLQKDFEFYQYHDQPPAGFMLQPLSRESVAETIFNSFRAVK